MIEEPIMKATQKAISSPIVESLPEEKFARSGIIMTDDEITVDISNTTGLRKTDFSEQIYSESSPSRKAISNNSSRIPRSPLPIRRKSVDNLCMTEREEHHQTSISRKIPQYRSVRKPTASSAAKEAPVKDNTWSGRTQKRRPSVGNETYNMQSHSHSKPNSPSPNRKNNVDRTTAPSTSTSRPPVQYDQNGRRIKPISASANTSPIKGRIASPLAQQFLEAAGEAKDDAQFLAKMKALLAKYTKNEGNFDDFTTAWVNGNGTVQAASPPDATTARMNKKTEVKVAQEKVQEIPRKAVIGAGGNAGSRIPAPVRSNTGIY